MRRRSYQLDGISLPKYKYSFNQKTFDLSLSASLDNKIGAYRAKPTSLMLEDKIKQSSGFTLQKLIGKKKIDSQLTKTNIKQVKNDLKLPALRKRPIQNPEIRNTTTAPGNNKTFYMSRVARALEGKQANYLTSLARQHFQQIVQAVKIGKTLHMPNPARQIKLSKKNPKLKTVCLDLDECLVHCDQMSNNYTVKLDFPIEGGNIISAGVRVRPHCQEFIRELSTFAEIIIFTASSPSYADVVLDYLDPHKRYFSHRLYRQHCTLEKGFFTKDLRCINRRMQDMVLVDNSGFSFMIQPQNGIAILPYYHYNKDRQLLVLLDYLREVLDSEDVRQKLKKHFFWHKYLGDQDPKKVFTDNYKPLTSK